MSEKLTGHESDDHERDDRGNTLSSEQRGQRDSQMQEPSLSEKRNMGSDRGLPSQHMGTSHEDQSRLGGYQQQQHDLGGAGASSAYGSNRSMPSQQGPGPVMGGNDLNTDDWDEDEMEEEGGKVRRGLRRGGGGSGSGGSDNADEFQKRYW